MNRASPKDLRAMSIMANTFVTHGILFVPVPVSDAEDFARLKAQAWKKLEDMEAAAAAEESE